MNKLNKKTLERVSEFYHYKKIKLLIKSKTKINTITRR